MNPAAIAPLGTPLSEADAATVCVRSAWQVQPAMELPDDFEQAVQAEVPAATRGYLAQLLWQRGIRDRRQLAGYLNPEHYQPTGPEAFGAEMTRAIARLQRARQQQETVAIWGDFDADGVTATAVLWDGLGEFFRQQETLIYYIPNRLTESHGLSQVGLDRLIAQGVTLIVTCDTGSSNLGEIEYAQARGLELIITDHHTLPATRPPVTAILNSRYFPSDHPLAQLSGVAVAYKLVEGLYQALPQVPQQPLDRLLDLVAIGLIADLVELKGDCRYLAQRGIEQLQTQSHPTTATRPGLARLLSLCQRSGDRPTDIAFGIGPRINAVSRIQGDARFCVELLTSRDPHRCHQLAEATELANTRRKGLQRQVLEQVRHRLRSQDLSTSGVIVLADEQWPVGVLGLVAGQIAQEYERPTILLTLEPEPQPKPDHPSDQLPEQALEQALEQLPDPGPGPDPQGFPDPRSASAPDTDSETALEPRLDVGPNTNSQTSPPFHPIPALRMAKGSARSVHQIDLYELMASQAHLLQSFGGHPYAAGLSLLEANLDLLRDALNQQLRNRHLVAPAQRADLTVTVAELGQALFLELKGLEPCGMGNSIPKLRLQNCWFEAVRHRNLQDFRQQSVRYLRTTFQLQDDSSSGAGQPGFPGIWWGHSADELPPGRWDCIVELDVNVHQRQYQVRLIEILPATQAFPPGLDSLRSPSVQLLDWRQHPPLVADAESSGEPMIVLRQTPRSWDELRTWLQTPPGRGPASAKAKNQDLLSAETELRSAPAVMAGSLPNASAGAISGVLSGISVQAIPEVRPEVITVAIAFQRSIMSSPQRLWYQLLGIAKYLSNRDQTATHQQLMDQLQVSDRTLQFGIQALQAVGFRVLSTATGWEFLPPDPSVDPGKAGDRVQQFWAAIQEEQFQQRFFEALPLTTLESFARQCLNPSNH